MTIEPRCRPVNDAFEIDHVFVAVTRGAPEMQPLSARGFVEGPSNVHPGQGTACRRIFFENAYLELIWLEDRIEALAPVIARTGLAERVGGEAGASRLGIALRPRAGRDADPPITTWQYTPPYLPDGWSIPMAANSRSLSEPLIFFMPTSPESRAATPTHPNGARRITRVVITSPAGTRHSPALAWLGRSGCVRVMSGEAERIAVELEGDGAHPPMVKHGPPGRSVSHTPAHRTGVRPEMAGISGVRRPISRACCAAQRTIE